MEFSSQVILLGFVTIVGAATPLIFAALGELVAEKSGVLNLGVEGMMLVGAVSAFGIAVSTGNALFAVIAAILSGMLMALIFAVLTLSLQANQVATGLALTIFGTGLSALIGKGLMRVGYDGLPAVDIPVLSELPVLGPLFFQYDLLVYFALFLVVSVSWFLSRTKAGLILRAVGESQEAAHAMGYKVILVHYLATLFGGAMAGLGGAFLSLSYSPMWGEQMTAGRGWIAIALVVFAAWNPWRLLLGAYLFGGITIMQLHAQAMGVNLPSEWMSMLPYLATIIVLVLISRNRSGRSITAPASLGQAFRPVR
ncbi:MAG: ABC transporter permease [Thiotrichales bacterium]